MLKLEPVEDGVEPVHAENGEHCPERHHSVQHQTGYAGGLHRGRIRRPSEAVAARLAELGVRVAALSADRATVRQVRDAPGRWRAVEEAEPDWAAASGPRVFPPLTRAATGADDRPGCLWLVPNVGVPNLDLGRVLTLHRAQVDALDLDHRGDAGQ